jgi:hypothetical protein
VHPSARKLPPFDVTPFLSLPATHQFIEKKKDYAIDLVIDIYIINITPHIAPV